MTVITMSRTEIDRMSVLQDLADGRIRIAEASTLMGLGRRQVFRLAKAYGKTAGAGVTTAWQAEQPLLSDGFACRSDWHHQGALFRLWPNAGGEACRAAWDSSCARDTSAMDDRGGLWKDRRARMRPVH